MVDKNYEALKNFFEGKNNTYIADTLKVSRARISQILKETSEGGDMKSKIPRTYLKQVNELLQVLGISHNKLADYIGISYVTTVNTFSRKKDKYHGFCSFKEVSRMKDALSLIYRTIEEVAELLKELDNTHEKNVSRDRIKQPFTN